MALWGEGALVEAMDILQDRLHNEWKWLFQNQGSKIEFFKNGQSSEHLSLLWCEAVYSDKNLLTCKTNLMFWTLSFEETGSFATSVTFNVLQDVTSLESMRYISAQITSVSWVGNRSVLWKDGLFLIQTEQVGKLTFFFKLAYRKVNILNERHK